MQIQMCKVKRNYITTSSSSTVITLLHGTTTIKRRKFLTPRVSISAVSYLGMLFYRLQELFCCLKSLCPNITANIKLYWNQVIIRTVSLTENKCQTRAITPPNYYACFARHVIQGHNKKGYTTRQNRTKWCGDVQKKSCTHVNQQ